MLDIKQLRAMFEKFKYPLIVLAAGVLLMLIPTANEKTVQSSDESLVAEILSSAEGVGEAKTLISDNGVVIVCRGAGNASVRLDIINAVHAYTGFNSDKITILKMAD